MIIMCVSVTCYAMMCCVCCVSAEIRRFCVAVQKRVLDGIVDREVEKGEQSFYLHPTHTI